MEHTTEKNIIKKKGGIKSLFIAINPVNVFTSPKKLAVGGVAILAISIIKNSFVREGVLFKYPLFRRIFRLLESI